MVTKFVKLIAGSMFSTPIVIGWLLGWCAQYRCQPKPDQTIGIIQSPWGALDTIIILFSLLATIVLYGLILRQVQSQQKSVEMQDKSLQITLKDFTLRKKILTSEIVMNTLNKFSDMDTYKLINHLKTTSDVGYSGFDHDVLHLLNICESVAMQYYVLDLNLYIIDNQLGDMIIEIYENVQVKKIKKHRQHGGHLYSNIDKFYLILKKRRDEKNKANSSLN